MTFPNFFLKYAAFSLLLVLLGACGKNDELAIIHTPYGDMVVLLYEETPKHKANFLRLAKDGAYNGTNFHRVIKEFMVQGGDIDAKLGNPPGKETLPKIPAELRPQFFHKKGALAAARQHESVNPKRESNGSQFYVVQGRVYTPAELMAIENRLNYDVLAPLLGQLLQNGELPDIRAQIDTLQQQQNMEGIAALVAAQRPIIEQRMGKQTKHSFSEAQQKAYTSEGGVPFLDGGYTVFGQVVEGLAVIDSIAQQPVNGASLPATAITMTIEIKKMPKADVTAKYGYSYPNQ